MYAPSCDSRSTAAANKNAAGYPPDNDAVVMGTAVRVPYPADDGAATACRMTRDELQRVLQDSRYGADTLVFDTTFTRDKDGQPVCRACRLPIAQHGDGRAPPAREDASRRFPAPDLTAADVVNGLLESKFSRYVLTPPHWRGAPWYLPYMSFHKWGPITAHWSGSRKHGRMQHWATAVWRCNVPTADGRPCGHEFETKGCSVEDEAGGQMLPRQIIDMTPVHKQSDGTDAHAYFESHCTRDHRLMHQLPGELTTTLSGVCEHPGALCSCVLCYCGMCGGSSPAGTGHSFAEGLDHALPLTGVDGQSVMHALSRDAPQCDETCAYHVCLLPFLPPIILYWLLRGIGAVVSCCGFPWGDDEDCAPMLCHTCYARRRAMHRLLGASESVQASRCAAVFCCPCSELQVWREAYNSGVWPGLLCRGATAEEAEHMAVGAVRQRYGVRPLVVAGAGPGDLAAVRAAAMVDEFTAPAIAVSMS